MFTFSLTFLLKSFSLPYFHTYQINLELNSREMKARKKEKEGKEERRSMSHFLSTWTNECFVWCVTGVYSLFRHYLSLYPSLFFSLSLKFFFPTLRYKALTCNTSGLLLTLSLSFSFLFLSRFFSSSFLPHSNPSHQKSKGVSLTSGRKKVGRKKRKKRRRKEKWGRKKEEK